MLLIKNVVSPLTIVELYAILLFSQGQALYIYSEKTRLERPKGLPPSNLPLLPKKGEKPTLLVGMGEGRRVRSYTQP